MIRPRIEPLSSNRIGIKHVYFNHLSNKDVIECTHFSASKAAAPKPVDGSRGRSSSPEEGELDEEEVIEIEKSDSEEEEEEEEKESSPTRPSALLPTPSQ